MQSIELFEQLVEQRREALYREAESRRLAQLARAQRQVRVSRRRPDLSEAPTSISAEFWRGFSATLPLWIGIVPFGMAYVLAAQAAGLSAAEALGMSLLVNAGTSQLVATELFANGSNSLSILLATLIVNARHLPLAASLAAGLNHMHTLARAGLAFTLSDASYAVSAKRVLEDRSGAIFLLGSGASLYVSWQLGSVAGFLLGGTVRELTSLGLELVFPLTFLVLLTPYLGSRGGLSAALIAGSVALAGRILLPGGPVLLAAISAGCLVGALLEVRR
jgi:4-azaleucine resistance transporter AzlC